MTCVLVLILIYLAVLVGIVLLQIFLSKSERPWPGLIMPILSFLTVLVLVLGSTVVPPDRTTGSFIAEMIIGILLGNIPTFILLAIYFACRRKRRHKKQLEKMNIQDLD